MNTIVMQVMSIGETKKGYYAKLQTKSATHTVVEGLGESEKNKQLTYYVALTTLAAPKEQLIGKTINFCPDNYDIVESEFTPEGSNEPIKCKWCYAK